MSVCFVVGTRPNYMKTVSVFRAFERAAPHVRARLVHTGQHYDDLMSRVFFEELSMPEPDLSLGVGSGTHADQTARVLEAMGRLLEETRPSLLVVAGDVNSTLASALAAVKLHVPVAHIESGLRSFDDRMPEEHNRKLTDHMSSILLAHSESALMNLEREGIDSSRVHLVGNTMIDSVQLQLPRALDAEPWRAYGLEPGEYALVTLHRPSLVDESATLSKTFSSLEELSRSIPTLFPVHPRTRKRLEAQRLMPSDDRLQLVEPLGYLAFLGLEARARFVLTDSGGVQEETTALGVPCFTLRDTTERPVTVTHGTNTVLGTGPERIVEIPNLLGERDHRPTIPLWDGQAGRRAADVLVRFLEET